jgi:formate dehydrogenase subunit gamma
MTTDRIPRFSVAERISHWMAALSFLYAALTGLALWSHKLFWLASVFGGGSTVRGMHPWGGTIFAIALGIVFLRWSKRMRFDADDLVWLKQSHKYAIHETKDLPEPGEFNAGQMVLFWAQSLFALLLFASGIALWFPEIMPRELRLAAVLIHPVAAIGAIGGIIVHIYMGTAAVPGALQSMTRGYVSARWAKSHHPKWYRQIRGQ